MENKTPLTAEEKENADQIFLIHAKHMKIFRDNELEMGYSHNRVILDTCIEYHASQSWKDSQELLELKREVERLQGHCEDYVVLIENYKAHIEDIELQLETANCSVTDKDIGVFIKKAAEAHSELKEMTKKYELAVQCWNDERHAHSLLIDVVDDLQQKNERLIGAIHWALGYTYFPERLMEDGPYWWRNQLREKSGLTPEELASYTGEETKKEEGE
jgi:hypothetical protein